MLVEITRCRIETIVIHWTHCTNSSTNYRPQSASCSYYKSAPIESSISSGVPRTPRSRASLHGFQKGCVWARHCRARLSWGQLALRKPRAPLQCRTSCRIWLSSCVLCYTDEWLLCLVSRTQNLGVSLGRALEGLPGPPQTTWPQGKLAQLLLRSIVYRNVLCNKELASS